MRLITRVYGISIKKSFMSKINIFVLEVDYTLHNVLNVTINFINSYVVLFNRAYWMPTITLLAKWSFMDRPTSPQYWTRPWSMLSTHHKMCSVIRSCWSSLWVDTSSDVMIWDVYISSPKLIAIYLNLLVSLGMIIGSSKWIVVTWCCINYRMVWSLIWERQLTG